MLVRHGNVVSEGWWKPYRPEHNHQLYSLSKSFTSTAVGIASGEGKLNINEPVLKFFPEYKLKDDDYNLKQMRVRDLLTMSTGHVNEPPIGADVISSKSFLETEVSYTPGTHFKYNTAASFMLSAIVEKQTGEKLVDYLKPRFFEPLGISAPDWEENYQGIALGGYGLRVKTEDIATLGQLYLQKGEWNGKQLLSPEWVKQATGRQVSNGSNPKSDWAQGYGFQFWQCRHGAYRGDGRFGQFCIVFPEQNAVLAITSGYNDMGKIMNIVWDNLLPAFHYVPIPENKKDLRALKSKLNSLGFPTQNGSQKSPLWLKVKGKTYRFEPNDQGYETMTLSAQDRGKIILTIQGNGKSTSFGAGYDKWVYTPENLISKEPLAGSHAWLDDHKLAFRFYAYETPFMTSTILEFVSDDELAFNEKLTVGSNKIKETSIKAEAVK